VLNDPVVLERLHEQIAKQPAARPPWHAAGHA
jgi:hypothetical protein